MFTKVISAGFGSVFVGKEEEKRREEKHAAGHAAVACRLWEKEGSPSLSPCIYTSY
jgi:hypothetical protein